VNSALIIIDVQSGFLKDKKLKPSREIFLESLQATIGFAREKKMAIIHVHTALNNLKDRMPHWSSDYALTFMKSGRNLLIPDEAMPQSSELKFKKNSYSPFIDSSFIQQLKKLRIKKIFISGLYTHACIRAAAIDAYQMGFKVIILKDAVASTDPAHATISLNYLSQRGIDIWGMNEFKFQLLPQKNNIYICPDPTNTKKIKKRINPLSSNDIDKIISRFNLLSPKWTDSKLKKRMAILMGWKKIIQKSKDKIIDHIIDEVAKPKKFAEEEFKLGMLIFDHVLNLAKTEAVINTSIKNQAVRYVPKGTVALITPFNNPFAIPLGKILPAILYGNKILWKPAIETLNIAIFLKSLLEKISNDSIIQIIEGGTHESRILAQHPGIDAISFTGSEYAGKELAMIAANKLQPLQAEMGGNNSIIIDDTVDIKKIAKSLCRSIFSFSGQRCTAIRRVIILKGMEDEFIKVFMREVRNLKLGDPKNSTTDIGPLISQEHCKKLASICKPEHHEGDILCGGKVSKEWSQGNWFEPTIILNPRLDAAIVKQETFGPIAVILVAKNIESAVRIANDVEQGLLNILCSKKQKVQEYFMSHIKSGMISINQLPVEINPTLPFSGIKNSGFGYPEHGLFDKLFYTSTQTIYQAKPKKQGN
jgi:acyl-CoA reductase-like NAD-dependent aldehyde dehydrogenase/nicotinamidase-related amidase